MFKVIEIATGEVIYENASEIQLEIFFSFEDIELYQVYHDGKLITQ